MSNQEISTFNSFVMTQEELTVARAFNHLQKQEFHNLRTAYAADKLRMLADEPAEDTKFFRRVAYIDGCIAVLNYLIDLNPEVETSSEG